jgi:hypothetical protein
MLGVLLTGIVLLIAIWLPGWLSALIVSFLAVLSLTGSPIGAGGEEGSSGARRESRRRRLRTR